jgi:hypothetical protein
MRRRSDCSESNENWDEFARRVLCPPTLVESFPDLAVVIDAWGLLPEAVRPGIVAMVKTASWN